MKLVEAPSHSVALRSGIRILQTPLRLGRKHMGTLRGDPARLRRTARRVSSGSLPAPSCLLPASRLSPIHFFISSAAAPPAQSSLWLFQYLGNQPHRTPSQETPAPARPHPPPLKSELQHLERGPSSQLLSVKSSNSSLCSLRPRGSSCSPRLLPVGDLSISFCPLSRLVNISTPRRQFLH